MNLSLLVFCLSRHWHSDSLLGTEPTPLINAFDHKCSSSVSVIKIKGLLESGSYSEFRPAALPPTSQCKVLAMPSPTVPGLVVTLACYAADPTQLAFRRLQSGGMYCCWRAKQIDREQPRHACCLGLCCQISHCSCISR